jgi:FtsP/CotA-like multicopper oxidase with cupredoxin domain
LGLDNKVVSEADKILIKKGENVRIVLFNGSMMRHPMHLHGHDFRVLNGQEEYAPLKTSSTLCQWKPIPIEFNANVKGDWFSLSSLSHDGGNGSVFSYENQEPNPLNQN